VCPVAGFCISRVEFWGVLLQESRLDGLLVIIKGTQKFSPKEVNTRYIS